jgi:phage terminase large subunit
MAKPPNIADLESATLDERRYQDQREVVGNPRAYFPASFKFLFQPARYKVAYGGRGSGKSWSFARALVLLMCQKPLRVLCARELQNSITESVHRLLCDQIFDMGLVRNFIITDKAIRCINGGGFIFSGIRSNPTKIKSMEGIDICWVEEASAISRRSLELLVPTIRSGRVYTGRDGVQPPELWFTFNPDQADDPVYEDYVKITESDMRELDCISLKVNWTANPYFPDILRKQKDYDYRRDPETAAYVWGGECRTNGASQIFKGRYVIDFFKPPEDVRWYHGMDFGFANDPWCLTRSFITGESGVNEELWIENEMYEWKLETDSIPGEMRTRMPTSLRWPIKADAARPETISYLKRVVPCNIAAAEKWGGSVEDGITHLKAFTRIHIHSVNCPHFKEEARLYSYKVDRQTEEVLPIVVDAWNHGWDSQRYALDGLIHRRGADKVWARFAGHK